MQQGVMTLDYRKLGQDMIYGNTHVVSAESINCFKNRLDNFWKNQEIIYNFRAERFTEPETALKLQFDSK